VLLTDLAPAKINLYLHVGRLTPTEQGGDGYHPLASLVAFADIGDRVTMGQASRLSLSVTGPFGAGLDGHDNLILKALRMLGEAVGIGEPRLHVALDKRLPIAAGLGGGSADAGAVLRLAPRILGMEIDEAILISVAERLGADAPMCLIGRSALAEGRGERLTFADPLPPLHALFVNPGVPSSTGAVYRAYDDDPVGDAVQPPPPDDWHPATVIDWLAKQRNDLQSPALNLTPAIGTALTAVEALPDVRLTRMSGSGATIFGLFDDAEAVTEAAVRLSRDRPGWWIRPTVLGGVPFAARV